MKPELRTVSYKLEKFNKAVITSISCVRHDFRYYCKGSTKSDYLASSHLFLSF